MDHDVKIDRTKLKTLRNNHGWTQQHLAEVSDLSLRTVQRAEKTGVVSQETISALSAVFEVKRESWLVQPEEYSQSFIFKKRAWFIALSTILAFQCLAGIAVVTLVGEIPSLWLKTILLMDLSMMLFVAVLYFTNWLHRQ